LSLFTTRLAWTLAAALAGTLATPVAAAQSPNRASAERAPIWSVEIGVVASTPLVEDGNGVTVRAAPSPYVGGQVTLRGEQLLEIWMGLRASSGAVRVESTDTDWRAGRVLRYDLRVGAGMNAWREVTIGVSGFAGIVSGPNDVIPFRRSNGRLAIWGAELVGTRPLLRGRRIDLLLGMDAAHLAGEGRENPPLAGGWVGQLRLGIRHAFR
jgi:hypothetical protein